MNSFFLFFRREWWGLLATPHHWLLPFAFWLSGYFLFSLILPNNLSLSDLTNDVFPILHLGVLVMLLLFAALIAGGLLFQQDIGLGFINSVLLSGRSVLLYILAKLCGFSIFLGLPFSIVTLLALLLLYPMGGFKIGLLFKLFFCLLLFFMHVALLLGFVATLTKKIDFHPAISYMLGLMLVLPLLLPALLFMLLALTESVDSEKYFNLFLAFFLFALSIFPVISAWLLKQENS